MLPALLATSRWLFLALLVFAPWAYGCTEPWAIRWLNAGMALVLMLWVDGCVLRGVWPAVHRGAVVCIALLLVQGWWMALNPRFAHDFATHTFQPVAARFGWAPGTVDGALSHATMLRITGLLGMLLFTADLATSAIWRRRVWWTLALTGVSIVSLGLVQRVGAAPMIFWEDRQTQASFFATYYYAGNAGAFINLVLTPVAGLALLAARNPDAHVHRAIWLPGWLLCLAGVFVNTSRTAQAIALALTAVFVVSQARVFLGSTELPRRSVCAIYFAAVLAAVAALVVFSGWERTASKWAVMKSQINEENPRWQAVQAAVQILPDAGVFGLGPGTFGAAFPHYTGALGDAIAGIWRYTHNDYLQTAIEWGFFGAAVWAVLFFWGLGRCFACCQQMAARKPRVQTRDRLVYYCAGLSLAGVAIHALVDFPLQIASLQLYVATFLGLGWTAAKPREAAQPARTVELESAPV
jgi:O-antigen ligase